MKELDAFLRNGITSPTGRDVAESGVDSFWASNETTAGFPSVPAMALPGTTQRDRGNE